MIGKLTSFVQLYWDRYSEWEQRETFRSAVAWAGSRALSYEENEGIYKRFAARWNVGSSLWTPHTDELVPMNAFIAHANAFDREVGAAAVRRILAHRGIERIFELDEFGGYDVGLDGVLAFENSFDRYWTSDSADWLIHMSHEETVAFAGDWLVKAIQDTWPDWNQHLWPGTRSCDTLNHSDDTPVLSATPHQKSDAGRACTSANSV
jgi:hypothetical protein